MIYTGLPDKIILCRGMRQLGRPTHRHTVFREYGQAPEGGLCECENNGGWRNGWVQSHVVTYTLIQTNHNLVFYVV